MGLICLFYSFSFNLVFAERNQPTQEEIQVVEKHIQEKNIQNLTGWNGILFYCTSQDLSNKTLTKLCEKISASADFLASSANIDFAILKTAGELGFRSATDDYLILEVILTATQATKLPSAISANLRAYISYVETKDVSGISKLSKDGPRTIHRSGDLIMWERTVLSASSGSTDNHVSLISEGIEVRLKQFFTDFLKAKNKLNLK